MVLKLQNIEISNEFEQNNILECMVSAKSVGQLLSCWFHLTISAYMCISALHSQFSCSCQNYQRNKFNYIESEVNTKSSDTIQEHWLQIHVITYVCNIVVSTYIVHCTWRMSFIHSKFWIIFILFTAL